MCRSRSAWMSSKAGRWSRPPANTIAWCRWACSGEARRTSSKPSERFIKEGKLGKIALVEIYCYYHMRATENPPDTTPPAESRLRDVDRSRAMRPYNQLVHPRSWRAFMEYGNGIVGDMCVHMFDMTRWMLELGWPTRICIHRRNLRRQGEQGEHLRHADGDLRFPRSSSRLAAPQLGRSAIRNIPGARPFMATRERLKVSVFGYDFIPLGGQQPVHRDVTYELEQVSGRQDGKGSRTARRAGGPLSHEEFSAGHRYRVPSRSPTSKQGYISTASCILANIAMILGRTLTWDGQRQQIVNDVEAGRLLARSYRQPWRHPDPVNV